MTRDPSTLCATSPCQAAIPTDTDGRGFHARTRSRAPVTRARTLGAATQAGKSATIPRRPLPSLWPQTLGKTTDRVAG